jgi:hypothetical protein
MEYMSRGDQRPATGGGRGKHFDWNGRAVRIEWFIFTSLVALVLLVAIGWLILSNNNTSSGESGRVDTSKYQAVFLNGGATSGSVAYTTYFGHITKLNNSYVVLKDVYYLTTDQTNSNGSAANPQLTKLGCQQLHSPQDEMVINRSQVAFWENLQDSGKVVQAIKTFQQQNPNGPNCNANNSSSTNSTTNTQNTAPATTKP